jgi:CRISPR-associated protein Cas1
MPSLYLTQQGTRIKKEQEQFILSSADQELLEVSIPQVERILIYGNIQLTTAVIDTCLSANIPIVFLTQSGSYKGHIYNEKISIYRYKLNNLNIETMKIFNWTWRIKWLRAR